MKLNWNYSWNVVLQEERGEPGINSPPKGGFGSAPFGQTLFDRALTEVVECNLLCLNAGRGA